MQLNMTLNIQVLVDPALDLAVYTYATCWTMTLLDNLHSNCTQQAHTHVFKHTHTQHTHKLLYPHIDKHTHTPEVAASSTGQGQALRRPG